MPTIYGANASPFVRKVRVVHAEKGVPYELIPVFPGAGAPPEFQAMSPLAKIPAYRDGEVEMFESGAMVFRIAQRSERLMPRDPAGQARVLTWITAALNSVEPFVFDLVNIDLFNKGEAWTGVRNHTAKQNLQKMQVGDQAFYYHSNEGKEIVGIAEVIRAAYPDPGDKTGKFVCVDIKAVKPLKTPVSLETIKADKALAEMELVKFSRLSVQAVTPAQWKRVCKLGGV